MTEDREAAPPISPLDALRWHIEMGVDELIDDQPIDRYATAAIPPAAVTVPRGSKSFRSPSSFICSSTTRR